MNNRLLIGLVVLTVAMQATILYKQYRTAPASARRQEPVRDAPKGAVLDSAGLSSIGNTNSNVIIVEFSDYECPFCQRHATGVGKEVNKRFVAEGKIRHVFVNNPLAMHPNAKFLATAAICAAKQNRFAEMNEHLFEAKPKAKSDVFSIVSKLNMDADLFEQCLGDPQSEKVLLQDMKTAAGFGLTGTPAFGIGTIASVITQNRPMIIT